MKFSLSFLLLFVSLLLNAQNIKLVNASFEGIPHKGKKNWEVVDGWENCGFENETAPDLHPGTKDGKPFHAIDKQAAHGQTYIGMVTRDNETWEAIGQQLLDEKMKAGAAYHFSIEMARPVFCLSRSKSTKQTVNYNRPLVLRIWGSNNYLQRGELLAETKRIDHYDWKDYHFQLEPTAEWSWFILEVFYARPIDYMSNGSLLLDNCSDLVLLNDLKP